MIFWHYLHLLGVVVWLGGLLFMALALGPVMRRNEWQDLRIKVVGSVGHRFRGVAWTAFSVILVSGVVMGMMARGEARAEGAAYWTSPLVLAKMLVSLLCVVLSLLHDFVIGPAATRTGNRNRYSSAHLQHRHAANWLARINILLALSLMALGLHMAAG